MSKILYVEDEALLAITMEGALLAEGHIVALAFDGEEGIARALDFAPEIIVTDFMMPRLDGLTMLRRLDLEGIRVPTILTTAVPREDVGEDDLGRVGLYLGKPFSEDDLIAAVKSLASRS